MAPVYLELSDAGIIAAGGAPAGILKLDGPGRTSPGFALQDGRRLMVGRTAALQARRFPQQTISRFWDRLNTEPLRQSGFTAASHAELAYEHLKRIWSALESAGDGVVFCVPGHYRRDNLGLLLGIAGELKMDVRGFVPIALTAVSPAAGEIIHIDLHLHRCEATYLRASGELAQRDTASVPDAGLERLYRIWAKTAAREFLQATRFDLFHSAASEQSVYEQLPSLMAALTDHQTVRFETEKGGSSYHMPLQRRGMVEAAGEVYARISDMVASLIERNRLAGRPLAFQLSRRACGLPGLKALLAPFSPYPAEELAFGAAALGAAGCWPAMAAQNADRGPSRHTRRPVVQHPAAENRDTGGGTRPTHLLVENTAYPIGPDPLVIGSSPGRGNGAIRLAGSHVSARHCSIYREGGRVFLDPCSEQGTHVDGVPVTERTTLSIGQTVAVGEQGAPLRLIRCLPADGRGTPLTVS
ncbi:hypothetical protein DSCA_24480 [Desulfosarcina alkanivorans]|uniref:FHA domain-containing protein n=1 Tax=Desulfosarcina alkanivorans TaxID=571177 RepID=A0A5K7YHU5_9BACT|nr:FHA domain-containing protein [Desulfosarcina alkanivorans]BBO68518.1 hypothetical protein DSCA_24480 [Desulfosarcina alkanivorans]